MVDDDEDGKEGERGFVVVLVLDRRRRKVFEVVERGSFDSVETTNERKRWMSINVLLQKLNSCYVHSRPRCQQREGEGEAFP